MGTRLNCFLHVAQTKRAFIHFGISCRNLTFFQNEQCTGGQFTGMNIQFNAISVKQLNKTNMTLLMLSSLLNLFWHPQRGVNWPF